VKFRGLELFGVIERAEGKASAEAIDRTWNQQAVDIDRQMASGGRRRARRLLFVTVFMLCSAVHGAGIGATMVADPASQVSVHEVRGLYTVTARFRVGQPRSVALAVLTDYERIPRFMPDVKTSIVRERSAGRVLVEQEAVSGIMMFSKRIHLLLEVHEENDAVRFRDASGRSFAQYEGAWRLSQHDGQTIICYELSARPSFAVPEFLLTRLFKRDARQMIERLRTEIASRRPLPS
jgi:ribosome-associated toxin RatA of RatAB toxin-antitoxin module